MFHLHPWKLQEHPATKPPRSILKVCRTMQQRCKGIHDDVNGDVHVRIISRIPGVHNPMNIRPGMSTVAASDSLKRMRMNL